MWLATQCALPGALQLLLNFFASHDEELFPGHFSMLGTIRFVWVIIVRRREVCTFIMLDQNECYR